MRSFPSNFTAEKNKKTGAAPLLILKITVGAVDYYLGDHAFAVAGWNGGVTTLPWVATWGSVSEQLSGTLDEIRIADIAVDCLVDPDASPNMVSLAVASDLEKSPAILYLWFAGLNASTDPPQELFRGYVSEVDLPDETTVSLSLEDATVRLHNMVGTLITGGNYPNTDPDDIGRILPLPYGAVRAVPGRVTVAGLLTTLKADITAAAISCAVAKAEGIVANSTKFTIGSEVVKVTSVSGDTLMISRAQDGTAAAAHSAGDRLVENMSTPFVVVVSGRALTSIDKVVVRSGSIDIDVTDQCTRYTGQGGSQYGSYGAKGVVTISQAQAAVIRQRIGRSIENTLSISNPNHNHSYNESRTQVASNTPETVGGGGYTEASVSPTYPSVPGIIEQTNHYEYSWSGGDLNSKVYVNGVLQAEGYSSGARTWDGTTSGATPPAVRHVRGSGTGASVTLSRASREVVFSTTAGNTAQASALTGNINSVADLQLGGPVYADVSAPNTNPEDVVSELLYTWGGGVSLTLDGSFPAGYAFNGVILDQVELLPLLHRLAFQCRSWFKLAAGSARLVVRQDTLSSEKTIPACCLEGGRKVYRLRKTDPGDIVNVINLRFARDWTKPDGDDGYLAVSSASDATSIADYGERERPDLFRCDFITSGSMANSVRDFYLADLKRRKWLHEFDVFLDHAEIEFGDVVALGFNGNAVVEVMQSGFSPGGLNDLPKINMVGRG